MSIIKNALICFALLNTRAFAAGNETNRFVSQTAGFKFEKIGSWNFASIESWEEHKSSISFKDKNFENLVKERARTPLVIALKFKEPTEKVNPGFQIILRPLGQLEDKKPLELMEIALSGMKTSLEGFKVVSKPEEKVIGGLKGVVAKVAFKFSHPSLASPLDSETKIWIVPRSKYMFLISGNGMAAGDSQTETEFDQMVKSIEFEK